MVIHDAIWQWIIILDDFNTAPTKSKISLLASTGQNTGGPRQLEADDHTNTEAFKTGVTRCSIIWVIINSTNCLWVALTEIDDQQTGRVIIQTVFLDTLNKLQSWWIYRNLNSSAGWCFVFLGLVLTIYYYIGLLGYK